MTLSNLTPDDIYKLATAAAIIFGLYKTYSNNNRAAKRDTVEDLHRLVEKLEKRISFLENEAKERDEKIEGLEKENLTLRKRILEQDDWIRRLVAQVLDAGKTPVPSMRTDE